MDSTRSLPLQPVMSEAKTIGPEALAVEFARRLRDRDVEVPVGATITFARALAAVGLDRRPATYWAGRATLVCRPEDTAAFDAAFTEFWGGATPNDTSDVPARPITVGLDVPGTRPAGVAGTDDAPVLAVRYSPVETLRHRDFASYTPTEHEEARRLMADLRLAGARRRSRRLRPGRGRRGRPDVRRTVRRSLRAGGEPVKRAVLAPSERTRRVVLCCDVSGSMEPYTRALLRFVHAAVVAGSRVEAFALGTRLTRLTRELASHDPDAALAAAARRVVDWSGGTRLGEGLRAFNDEWGVRGLARGAVVVILSDGWDRGDPAQLAEQLQRLARVAHRIVWVNPLKATEGYAPLAGGMAAALPYVDEFLEGHSLASLETLVDVIGR
jgi:uncharacterized protein with von Willebrand factor type A (vWA) domain